MAAVAYIEEHTAEAVVRAGALELWNLLHDPVALAEARDDITGIEVLEGEPGEVGCRTRTMLKVGRTDLMLTEEIVKAERPRLLVKEALNPRVKSVSTWEIEEADGGCKVTATSYLEAQLGALQRFLVKQQSQRREREAIDALRDQCEQLSVYFEKRRENLGFDI